jgi:hypothetical protein
MMEYSIGDSGGLTGGLGMSRCGLERSDGEQHGGGTSLSERMVS